MSDTDTDTGGTGAAEKTVPYDRFQKVVAERNEWKSKATKFESDLQAHSEKAATADTLAAELQREKTERAKERAGWDAERAFIDAGLHDQEARDLAQVYYGRMPEKDRPAIGDWVKPWKDDPTKAPRGLQPFLSKPAEGGGAGAAAGSGGADPAGGAAGRRGQSTRAGADAGAPSSATAEPASASKLREVRQRAQQTGDWSEWKRVTGQATQQAATQQGAGGSSRA